LVERNSMPRGGKRTGAGRRPNKGTPARLAAALPAQGDTGKAFAERVLARIKTASDLKKIVTAEDYCLSLLFVRDLQTRSRTFNRLLDRKYGKPIQQVKLSNPDGESFEVKMTTSAREKLWAKLLPDAGPPAWHDKSGPEEDGASPPDDGSIAEAAVAPTADTPPDQP
jgi:hypothetical protein